MYTAQVITSVQAQIATFPLGKLLQYVEAIDVIGGTVLNASGVITIGGRALTNQQYYQLYEMISPQVSGGANP
jgi:hypothetical protein